jgi:ubiquinone/menaquinone biosynthesis C-methylase UbiE
MNELTKKDAIYHEKQKERWIEGNQLDTVRNLFFHKKVLKFMANRAKGSDILELGGGVGFDMGLFMNEDVPFSTYIFSEISESMVSFVANKIIDKRIIYCCIDAHHIPFEANKFDFVIMISAAHHLQDIDTALKEIIRVTKKGGYIIFGIEPNKLWQGFISKIRGILLKLLPKRDHSPADEKAEGFSIKDFENFEKKYGIKLIKLESVWFFCGFIHYGLEFIIYQFFRMKKRIKLPIFIEELFVHIDVALFRITFIKKFSWHYIAIYRK